MLLSGCPASFPCDLCWRCNACVWVCKLRTALEATWACGCVCVSVYQHTHTHLSNKNDLNRTRWKCFLPAYEYVRKYTQQASCTGNCEPQRRRETRTHAQRKVNLHTSCHSKPAQQPEHQTLPHAKREPTQRKLKSCSTLLTGWWGGAVSTERQSRQGWRRQAPQHVGEEVGVGGHGEAVEVGARHRVALPSHDGSVHLQVTKRPHWGKEKTLTERQQRHSQESVWIPVRI